MSDLHAEDTLASLVRSEAARVLTEAQLLPDPQLVAQGWDRRFITDATRATEAVQLYRELGYEVRLEPVLREQFAEECEACLLVTLLRFQTIYTRKAG